MNTDEYLSGSLLKGRTALITGGVGAIGAAVAHAMAAQSADIVVVDLNETAANEVATSVSQRWGVTAVGEAVDVSSVEALEALSERLESQGMFVDTVVPNAGVLIAKDAVELSAREWDLVLGVNLTGAFHTASVFARRLLHRGDPGTIIFTSSLFGKRGGRLNAAYSATKFGVIGIAQSMAAELAHHGIRVNSVCPGQIHTDMLDKLFAERALSNNTSESHERDIFVNRIPAKRLGTPQDVANTFVYLASELSAYVTGEAILIDGGWEVG